MTGMREREREDRGREWVSVCVREGNKGEIDRERVCVCERECVCMRERKTRKRETVSE
jgi:hypothetical protein